MERYNHLPAVPDDVIEGTYHAALDVPRHLIGETIDELTSTSPALATARIIDGLRTSVHHGSFDTLWYLRLILFTSACLNRAMRQEENLPISISRLTLDQISEERFPSNSDLLKGMESYNPKMAYYLEGLKQLSFLEGVEPEVTDSAFTKTLRSLLLYERQLQSPFNGMGDPEEQMQSEAPTHPVLKVRRTIINDALLDIALTPARITKSVATLNGFILNFASTSRDLPPINELEFPLMLFSGLISQTIVGEHKARGLPVPAISMDLMQNMSSKFIENLKKSIADRNNPNDFMNDEIRATIGIFKGENSDLFSACELIGSVFHIRKPLAESIMYNLYKIWRAQMEAEYWEEKSK